MASSNPNSEPRSLKEIRGDLQRHEVQIAQEKSDLDRFAEFQAEIAAAILAATELSERAQGQLERLQEMSAELELQMKQLKK